MFTTTKTFGVSGRAGSFETRVGTILTPTFMPVGTRGTVKNLETESVKSTGVQIILGNTYHLHLQPGEKVIQSHGGLHSFMRWPRPILTDSGGFQVFSLAHARKITEDGVSFKDPKSGSTVFLSPEESIRIQLALGGDIIMAFDDLTGLDDKSRHRTSEALERTHRWLDRSSVEFKKQTKGMKERPLLFGIAQGGLDKESRAKSLEFVQSTDVDGIAIGGLSVGEPRKDMHEMLDFLADKYDPGRPHYLMGVGHPANLRYAFERGIDMADCVLATRNARHGSVWISGDKKISLKTANHTHDLDPIEVGCDCQTCQRGYSRAWLRHQFKVEEPLAGALASIHNIRYLERMAESYR